MATTTDATTVDAARMTRVHRAALPLTADVAQALARTARCLHPASGHAPH
jgi:hypothetical protein